ncbi:MAG: PIG-L family deacetylase, partial [Chloroflexi bacterium]|nr:PIG-L family deacetylase [Chloroflexota bacterium]
VRGVSRARAPVRWLVSDRRLLAVFAHPDDELSAGGTLAHYAREGASAHLVCATRGEVGEAPPDLKGFTSVGEMREDELQCACNVLGLTSVSFLGYRDSGMPGSADNSHPQALAAAPTAIVARQVAGYIRRLKPQVVITFDPIGGYRHPDHLAIHNATVQAFRLAGDSSADVEGLPPHQPAKLYYTTFSRRLIRNAVRVLRLLGRDPSHFGKNKDVDLASLVSVDYPVHARISVRDVAAQKEHAAACHSSQLEGMGGGAARLLQRLFTGDETYMRAVPAVVPIAVERDLFEGIVA